MSKIVHVSRCCCCCCRCCCWCRWLWAASDSSSHFKCIYCHLIANHARLDLNFQTKLQADTQVAIEAVQFCWQFVSYCRLPRNEAITRSVVCLSVCLSALKVQSPIDLGAFTSGESCRHLFGCLVRTSLACNLICTHTRNTHTHTLGQLLLLAIAIAVASRKSSQPLPKLPTAAPKIYQQCIFTLSLFPLLCLKMPQTVAACFFFFYCCCCLLLLLLLLLASCSYLGMSMVNNVCMTTGFSPYATPTSSPTTSPTKTTITTFAFLYVLGSSLVCLSVCFWLYLLIESTPKM